MSTADRPAETIGSSAWSEVPMEPLDLRVRPPREPRAELAGTVFLPRSIDKLRATLPGGDIGEYSIEGFTEKMLATLGLSVDDMTRAVASAATDDEVAAYVAAHARPNGIDEWNAFARNREIFNGDRAAAVAEIPWLADRPDIRLSLDLLAEDDRRSFPG